MEDRKTTMHVARLRTVFRRAVLACRGRSALPQGPSKRVAPDSPFSYGSWPGHEASYPVIHRLLWEIGKKRRQEEERKSGEAPNRFDKSFDIK